MRETIFESEFSEQMVFLEGSGLSSYLNLGLAMYPISKAIEEGAKESERTPVQLHVFNESGEHLNDILEQEWPFIEGVEPDLSIVKHAMRREAEDYGSELNLDEIKKDYEECDRDGLKLVQVRMRLIVQRRSYLSLR